MKRTIEALWLRWTRKEFLWLDILDYRFWSENLNIEYIPFRNSFSVHETLIGASVYDPLSRVTPSIPENSFSWWVTGWMTPPSHDPCVGQKLRILHATFCRRSQIISSYDFSILLNLNSIMACVQPLSCLMIHKSVESRIATQYCIGQEAREVSKRNDEEYTQPRSLPKAEKGEDHWYCGRWRTAQGRSQLSRPFSSLILWNQYRYVWSCGET